jgi:hypothetical protein
MCVGFVHRVPWVFSRCVPVLRARDVHAEMHVLYMLYILICSPQGVPKVFLRCVPVPRAHDARAEITLSVFLHVFLHVFLLKYMFFFT